MAPLTPNDRQRRILQLSSEWGIEHPPVPPRLSRPQHPPSFRSAADDQVADDILQRRALEASQIRPKSGLSRAFSSNNLKKGKNAEPRELVEALFACVANGQPPGVAEAILAKLAAAGIELGSPTARPKSGMLSRKKSIDSFVDRGKLLRLAVENDQPDMLSVLLPHADPVSLDTSLPLAVRKGNSQTTELLLRYGANLGQTADGQDAFRQACLMYGQAKIISLILHSDGRPSPETLSACLVDAVGAGDLEAVLYLTRSVADSNYNEAESLKTAVRLCRHDLALATIMGNKPPQRPGVDDAFGILIDNTSMPPTAKLQMAELLLCAGARGPILSRALQQAWETQFLQMANLLAAHGASMGDNDASVLKDAIRREEHAFVETLLGGSSISPVLASECVPCIPKQTSPELRAATLKLLLRSGASGEPLHEMLIDAAEANDLSCIGLLLKPYIRQRASVSGNPVSPMENDQDASYFRHAVASTDYKDGEALRTAVLRGDELLVKKLLEGRPSHDTLAKVFPLTSKLGAQDRYKIVETFLQGSLAGPSLHSALQDALAEERTSRDGALIQLLLEHNADINYKQGSGLRTIISDMDIQLLSVLVQKASPQTAAARIADVMAVSDHRTRHDMMVLLLRSGAAIGAPEVAAALLKALEETPVDMSLLRLLLQSGSADINLLEGKIVQRAVRNPDPKVLELVLGLGKPSAETITRALTDLGPLPSTEAKTWKLKVILSKSHKDEDLSAMLVNEVQSLVKHHKRSPSFSTLKHLLESGADPNAYNAAALHHAVRSSDTQMTDILFSSRVPPTASSLGSALPHALRIADPMDRLTFTKKLVESGADPLELNRALIHAINTFTDDLSLLSALAEAADASDGEALAKAVNKEAVDVVDMLLARTKHTEAIRNSLLETALAITDREKRREICSRILKAGTAPTSTSAALLIAARDGDLPLGDILISHGATISPESPSPVVEACRHGSTSVLGVLLKASPTTDPTVLKRGFQAATEVGDLNKRAVIFEMLLERGVTGEIVDMQLGSAARYGDDGHEILRVLLAAGADPNYNRGDAIVAATKSAFMRNLELLLGLWDEKSEQKRPSHPTLSQALKASWKLTPGTRFDVMQDLFKAGLTAGEEVHVALSDAVNEEEPDEKLIKLLLDHGASPTSNNCKALVDATNNEAHGSLKLLLGGGLSAEHLGQVFVSVFTEEKFLAWFTDRGYATAKSYIDKGVQGSAISSPLVLVMREHGSAKSDLSAAFVELLLTASPDVDYNNGEPLRLAASQANVAWTSALMAKKPNVQTLSFAFQHIFDTALTEDDALDLFKLFADYRDGETRIDVTVQQRDVQPILVRAMTQYPRKATILETLLDAGLYHDQMTTYKIHEDIEEEEEMTLLTWALAQPQKRISPALIEVLLERGGK